MIVNSTRVYNLAEGRVQGNGVYNYTLKPFYLSVSTQRMKFSSLCKLSYKYLQDIGVHSDLASQKLIFAMFTLAARTNKNVTKRDKIFLKNDKC